MKEKKNSIKIVLEILTITVTIAGIVPLYLNFFYEQKKEKEEEVRKLLELAEYLYKEGDYEGMAYIYSDERLKDNEKVLLNVGVMYANGIYFRREEERAKQYFRSALEHGENYYALQYLLQYLNYDDMDEIIELVKIGCEHENRYCEKLLQDLYKEAGKEAEGTYLLDYNKKTEEEKKEILENMYLLVGKYTITVATDYKYIVSKEEGKEATVEAEVIGTEERETDIELFVKRYFGNIKIHMVFY